MNPRLLLLPLLAACGSPATWTATTWGEEYIEDAIPAEAFADGCSATFDSFLIVLAEAALVDGDGADVAAVDGARVFDMALAGPHTIADLEVPAGHYDEARFVIGPAPTATGGNVDDAVAADLAESGASIHAVGTLTCPGGSKTFNWTFDTATTYHCEPEDLTLAAGGAGGTEFTVHGDHFFYDDLVSPDAEVRGLALFDAGGADGDITQAELAATPLAPLGYGVGPQSEVTELGAFVAALTSSLGHVDGEGHCGVE